MSVAGVDFLSNNPSLRVILENLTASDLLKYMRISRRWYQVISNLPKSKIQPKGKHIVITKHVSEDRKQDQIVVSIYDPLGSAETAIEIQISSYYIIIERGGAKSFMEALILRDGWRYTIENIDDKYLANNVGNSEYLNILRIVLLMIFERLHVPCLSIIAGTSAKVQRLYKYKPFELDVIAKCLNETKLEMNDRNGSDCRLILRNVPNIQMYSFYEQRQWNEIILNFDTKRWHPNALLCLPDNKDLHCSVFSTGLTLETIGTILKEWVNGQRHLKALSLNNEVKRGVMYKKAEIDGLLDSLNGNLSFVAIESRSDNITSGRIFLENNQNCIRFVIKSIGDFKFEIC